MPAGFDVVLTKKGLSAIESATPGHLATVRHCFADVLTKSQLEALAEAAEAAPPAPRCRASVQIRLVGVDGARPK